MIGTKGRITIVRLTNIMGKGIKTKMSIVTIPVQPIVWDPIMETIALLILATRTTLMVNIKIYEKTYKLSFVIVSCIDAVYVIDVLFDITICHRCSFCHIIGHKCISTYKELSQKSFSSNLDNKSELFIK